MASCEERQRNIIPISEVVSAHIKQTIMLPRIPLYAKNPVGFLRLLNQPWGPTLVKTVYRADRLTYSAAARGARSVNDSVTV